MNCYSVYSVSMVIVTATYGDQEPQLPFSLGLQAEPDTGERCVCVYRVVNAYLCVCACVSSLVCTRVCTYVRGGRGCCWVSSFMAPQYSHGHHVGV